MQPPLEATDLTLLMAQNTGGSTLLKFDSLVPVHPAEELLCLFSVCLRNLFILISSCSGCYGPDVNLKKLKDFHRRRLQVLVEAGPDLLAFETIPNKLEAQVFFFFFSFANKHFS